MTTRMLSRRTAALLLASAPLARPAGAQSGYPDHTITIVVHFAPGGSNDLLGRFVAAELAPMLGQSVIVENRPGANGNVGLAYVARAKPDGYTLVVASGVILVNATLGKTNYDPLKDFAPIAYLGTTPTVFLTRPDSGLNTIEDLLAKAKAKPGTINFSSAGVGSISQLSVELMELRTGTKMVHVPFAGAAPAAQAAIAGTVDFASVNVSGLMGLITSGTLKALAQTGTGRWPELSTVPTLDDAGIHHAQSDTPQVFLAPAGTPQPVIDRLAKAVLEIAERPAIKQKMFEAGFAMQGHGPEWMRDWMPREIARWKEVIEQANLKVN